MVKSLNRINSKRPLNRKRNTEAFLKLVSRKSLNLTPLISHTFNIEDAEAAYDIVLGKNPGHHVGILLRYPENERKMESTISLKTQIPGKLNIGFIGAGSFAQSYLIPHIKSFGATLDTVVTSKGITSKNEGEKFGFGFSSENTNIKPDDNVIITVKFQNGSIGNLTYLANGDKSLSKEHIKIFNGGRVSVIHDFRNGTIYANNKFHSIKKSGKGHQQEINAFLERLMKGEDAPISFRSVCLTIHTTFKIIDSLATGLPQEIKLKM